MVVLGNLLLIVMMLSLIGIAGLKWAVGGWMPFMTLLATLAALCFASAIALNFRHYWAIIKSDSFHFIAKSASLIVLVFLTLTAVNYLAHKNNRVFDLTSNKINSLSEYSQEALKSLDEDFVFYFFRSDSPTAVAEEEYIRQVLENYTRASDKVRLKVVSIYKQPELAKKFAIGEESAALFASYGERRKRLQVVSEIELTNAILQLSRSEKKIYFTQNHGERDINSEDSYGLALLKAELERLFYKVKPLESFPIPSDASFVVIAGPKMEFSDPELNQLREYILKGGSLLVAVDPGEAHNLAQLTKSYNIEFQNTFVSSKGVVDQSAYTVFVSPTGEPHDLLATMKESQRPVLFLASPLKLFSDQDDTYRTTPLLRFADESQSRVAMDLNSPMAAEGGLVAAAVTEPVDPEQPYFRILTFGDSDFLTNQFFSQHGNFNFIFNSVNYLSKDTDMLKVRPRQAQTTYLLMTQTDLNFYFLLFILPFPFLYFMIALFFRLRRAL